MYNTFTTIKKKNMRPSQQKPAQSDERQDDIRFEWQYQLPSKPRIRTELTNLGIELPQELNQFIDNYRAIMEEFWHCRKGNPELTIMHNNARHNRIIVKMSQLKQQQTIPYFRTLCRYSLTLISTLFFMQYDRGQYSEYYEQLLATIPEDEKEIDVTYFRYFGLATYALPALRSTLAQIIYYKTGINEPTLVRRQILKSRENINKLREMQALRRPSSCHILGINNRISRIIYMGLVKSARMMITVAENNIEEQKAAEQAAWTQSTTRKHERDNNEDSGNVQDNKKIRLRENSAAHSSQFASPIETWQRYASGRRSILGEIPVTLGTTNINDEPENPRSTSRP